jgi:hypothetical protein
MGQFFKLPALWSAGQKIKLARSLKFGGDGQFLAKQKATPNHCGADLAAAI